MGYRYHKIAAALRSHVQQLQPGDFLEPEQLLAQKHAVSHMTMRQALNVLVEEGWLRRQRGKGSVVVDRLSTGEFGVVLSPEMLSAVASPFYRLATSALVEHLRSANSRYRANIHLGKAATPDKQGFAETVGLLDPRVAGSLRGVFTFKPLYEVGEALEARGIPVVRIGRGTEDWTVWYDSVDLIRQGVAHLAACGCRRPALVWAYAHRPTRPEDALDARFSEAAYEHRMTVWPEWIAHVEGYNWTEQNGYDLFCAIWHRGTPHPDGLLVADDGLCRGVLRAVMHLGVNVPGDLQLISHANEGVALPFHLRVTRLEMSPTEFARQACEMMLRRCRSVPLKQSRIDIPVRLVSGQTTTVQAQTRAA